MTNPNPATPAQAAIPGSNEPGTGAPSANPPSPTGTGGQPEGQVTIPTKEYAQLQRDAARVRSADRRSRIAGTKQPPAAGSGDPAVDEQISIANQSATEANDRAFRAEVKAGVRDILDKPEYQSIPKSTRDLILKNPASLSEAKDVETALLDVEDFLIEQASFEKGGTTTQPKPTTTTQPANTETPPKPGGNGPDAASGESEMEDVTNLRGSARTRAMIRNKVKAGKQ